MAPGPHKKQTLTAEEQAQLAVVRAGLLEAYRQRGLGKVASRAGLKRTTVHRVWSGATPKRRTLQALYAVLGP